MIFRKLKWTFWLGLITSIIGVFGMFSAWYYFNLTKDVAFVKSYVSAGGELNVNNIEYKPIRIQNLPENYLTQQELSSQKWRAVDGIQTTDPLTRKKVTSQIPLVINPDQVFVSYNFPNTGLLTYINPGDKITIVDGSKIIENILVLGKADKDSNLIALLPVLQESARKEAQGLLAAASDSIAKSTVSVNQTAALILLLDVHQAQDLQKMSKPIATLQTRALLTEVVPKGGVENVSNTDSNEPQ